MKKVLGWCMVVMASLTPAIFIPLSNMLKQYKSRTYRVIEYAVVHIGVYPLLFTLLMIGSVIFLYRAFQQMAKKPAVIIAGIGFILTAAMFIYPDMRFKFLHNTYCCMTQSMVITGWLMVVVYAAIGKKA